MDEFTFTVEKDDEENRIDHYLVKCLQNISRTKIQKLLREGQVTVNGQPASPNYRVREADQISAVVPPSREFHLEPQEIPLEIVYEDDDLLVINKPAGMVVHPGVGNWKDTLLNGLLFYLQGEGGKLEDRPGLVHRLDKETSGLLIAAKTENILNYMQGELKARRIKRKYQAIIWGHLKEESGMIDLPIGRLTTDRRKMAVTDWHGRDAITNYELITRYKFADHLDIALQTGRTHQIRVHFSHLGHPLLGDREYGGDDKALPGIFDQYRPQAKRILEIMPRQCLHAYRLEFKQPHTGLIHTIKSELPEEMKAVIAYLKSVETEM